MITKKLNRKLTVGVERMVKGTLFDLVSRRGRLLLLAGVLFLMLSPSWTTSAAGDPTRYRPGLRNSPYEKKLDPKELETVLKSLREKSGFLEMGFDESGFLTLGDRNRFEGGSATARQLLAAAADATIAVDLESHKYSAETAFARMISPIIYQSQATGKRIEVIPIELDLTDFGKLRGDRRVLAAFDPGFVILHELGHAVLGLRDAGAADGPGECEEYINRIRRELKLPLRQNYIARLQRSVYPLSASTTDHAELHFEQTGDGGTKPQKYVLKWEAGLVGPIKALPAPPLGNPRPASTITVQTHQ